MNTIISLSRRSFALLGAAIVAGGCTSTYRFDVDAVKHPSAEAELRFSYRLVPAHPELAPDDLRIRQVARDVRTALSSKGLFEAPESVVPQLDIEFDFGLEGPIVVERTIDEPIIQRAGDYMIGAVSNNDGAPFLSSARIDEIPFECVGTRLVTVRTKEFRKFLRLTARPAKVPAGGKTGPSLWSVFVENQDQSDNVRKYVRLMTAAAMDVIGEDSTSVRSIKLTDRDGRVVFVQTGMPK